MEQSHIYYREGYKYQLAEDYQVTVPIWPEQAITTEYIDLTTNGLLTIRNGYAWDGPSGPTFDTPSAMRASLVHDALYQLMRQELLPASCREVADDELKRFCLEDRMWRARAWYFHRSVRRVGALFADPSRRKEVLIAPYPEIA